jgi:1,4-dihydroxy-2-naphthoate polyprenyltransferase
MAPFVGRAATRYPCAREGPGPGHPMYGLLVSARLFYLSGGLALYGLGALFGRAPGWAWDLVPGAVVVVLVHLLTHWVNDAEDVATDDQTTDPTLLSGGSRAIQRGLITPPELLRASAVAAAVVGVVAAAVAARGDGVAAALFLAMLALGYAYSGRPFMLGRRGLGEVTAAVVMGLLVPLAGAHAAGGLTSGAWQVTPLLVLMTIFARLCTAFPDLEADRATGKWTVPALLGPRRSALAFGLTSAALLVAGLLGQVSAAMPTGVATAIPAAVVAGMVATGTIARAPVVAPLLGMLGYGAGLVLLTAAAIAG